MRELTLVIACIIVGILIGIALMLFIIMKIYDYDEYDCRYELKNKPK